jgi:hypothetical protein
VLAAVAQPGDELGAIPLQRPVQMAVYVAANGAGTAPPGLYRLDLGTGVITLLASRTWSGNERLLGFSYGVVVVDDAVSVVNSAGQSYGLHVKVDAAEVDADGIHLWIDPAGTAPSVLRRIRIDGGGTQREVTVPQASRLIGVDADGRPLLTGPAGGTFALDPATAAVTKLSDGILRSAAGEGRVELVCDAVLDCHHRWVGPAGETLELRGDPAAEPSLAADGTMVALGTAEGVEVVQLPGGNLLFKAAGEPFMGTPSRAVWSPDGKAVAFTYFRRLLVMHLNGNAVGAGLENRIGAVMTIAAAPARA